MTCLDAASIHDNYSNDYGIMFGQLVEEAREGKRDLEVFELRQLKWRNTATDVQGFRG
jgi:hypothetical protein